jgi:hypothetical protein
MLDTNMMSQVKVFEVKVVLNSGCITLWQCFSIFFSLFKVNFYTTSTLSVANKTSSTLENQSLQVEVIRITRATHTIHTNTTQNQSWATEERRGGQSKGWKKAVTR